MLSDSETIAKEYPPQKTDPAEGRFFAALLRIPTYDALCSLSLAGIQKTYFHLIFRHCPF